MWQQRLTPLLLLVTLASCKIRTGDNYNDLTGLGEVVQYTITVTAEPAHAGVVSGGGKYLEGGQVQVRATARPGWTFSHFREGEDKVSEDFFYGFPAEKDRDIIAVFGEIPPPSPDSFLVRVSASPPSGGSALIQGDGTMKKFQEGDTVTVVASAHLGYQFMGWTHEGQNAPILSTSTTYKVVVMGPIILVAVFEALPPPPPTLTLLPQGGTFTLTGVGSACKADIIFDLRVNGASVAASAWEMTRLTGEAGTPPDLIVNGIIRFFTPGTYRVKAYYTEYSVYTDITLVSGCTNPPPQYLVTVSASPPQGGSVGGGGFFTEGAQTTVWASPVPGWDFLYWEEGSTGLSTNLEYTFVVNSDRYLKAVFGEIPPPPPPPTPQCSDGHDNDGDGKIDLADPGCSGPNDDSESGEPAPIIARLVLSPKGVSQPVNTTLQLYATCYDQYDAWINCGAVLFGIAPSGGASVNPATGVLNFGWFTHSFTVCVRLGFSDAVQDCGAYTATAPGAMPAPVSPVNPDAAGLITDWQVGNFPSVGP